MTTTIEKQINILIVDDQIGMLETFTDILEDKGFRVQTAEDGFSAIEKARENAFDVIFMDIQMPGINGVQTFRELKKMNSRVTVVMMTAYALDDLIAEAVSEGAFAVLYKPFDIEKVVQIIEQGTNKSVILVVDDSFEERQTLKDALETKGHRVTTAANGQEAIEFVQDGNVGVILMDVRMPGIDGIQTFEQVHKIRPEVPVIFITGYSIEEALRDAVSKGAYACLQKPLDMEKIVTVLQELKKTPV
jgi:two-component system response regulator HydG